MVCIYVHTHTVHTSTYIYIYIYAYITRQEPYNQLQGGAFSITYDCGFNGNISDKPSSNIWGTRNRPKMTLKQTFWIGEISGLTKGLWLHIRDNFGDANNAKGT